MLLEQFTKHSFSALSHSWAQNRSVVIKYTLLGVLAIVLLSLIKQPLNQALLDFYLIAEKFLVITAAVTLTLSIYKLITDHNYPKTIWLDAFFYPVNLGLIALVVIGNL